MKAKYLIAVSGLLSGCNNAEQDHFEPFGFDGPHMAVLRSAATEWCERSDGRKCPVLEGGGGAVKLRSEMFAGGPDTVGLTVARIDGTSDIYVLNSLQPDEMRLVLVHEFGHHFGCDHVDDGSAMSPDIAKIVDPSVSDGMLECRR